MKNNCLWEEIEDFQSPYEFKKFISWLEAQINSEIASEIPVKASYAGPYLKERWILCIDSGQVWRIVYPDGPFYGYWGLVV